jgi:sugar phosphate isomerase/epimerase
VRREFLPRDRGASRGETERPQRRASRRILGFHVNDWVAPTRDPLLERGMMGDGVIELRRIRAAVDDAGYLGPIEVEIFNPEIWGRPGDEILATMKERYAALV